MKLSAETEKLFAKDIGSAFHSKRPSARLAGMRVGWPGRRVALIIRLASRLVGASTDEAKKKGRRR